MNILIIANSESEASSIRTAALTNIEHAYIKPPVLGETKRSWICRGWISNPRSEKGDDSSEPLSCIIIKKRDATTASYFESN